MNLEKVKDGDVVCIDGIDLVKCGGKAVRLDNLLTWPALEREMRKLPQKELEVVNTFSGGVYLREMHIPAGTFIIGKRHRHETCNVLLKGTLSVYLGDNKPVVKVSGPLIMTSEPMVRKIAYCHEDAVFINLHPTTETDVEKIEQEFIVTEQEFLAIKESQLCLGAQ